MNVELEKTGALTGTIKIAITRADYAEKLEAMLKRYRREAQMPGFRKGQAPAALIKKLYGTQAELEIIDETTSEALYKFIEKEKIDIMFSPLMSEQQEMIKLEDETHEFAFDIALRPTYDQSLDENVKLTYYEIEVGDKQVDERIDVFCNQNGKIEPVEECDETQDMIKGDMTEVGNEEHTLNDVHLLLSYFVDDEQKALFKGAKVGDTVVFTPKKALRDAHYILKIDKNDTEAPSLESDYAFKVGEITRHVPSAVNEDLFKKVFPGEEIADVEAFRAKVKEGIEADFKRDSDYKFGIDLRDMLVEKWEVEFPKEFIIRWFEKNEKDEKIESQFSEYEKSWKWHIICSSIAQKHEIKLEMKDIEKQVAQGIIEQWARYGMQVPADILDQQVKETLKSKESFSQFEAIATEQKVIAKAKECAKISTKKVSFEDFKQLVEK